MNHIEAMKLALDALEKSMEAGGQKLRVDKAITALRQAIEQAEDVEPFAVAWAMDGELFWPSEYEVIAQEGDEAQPLYTTLSQAIEQTEKQENDGFIEFKAKSFECLRLDKRGFHYKGQVIEDAGEAWRRFNDWLTAAFVELAEKQEPVAQAWDEGYQAGVNDERMSEANIGIAGFDAKVEPARNNPYRITQPAPTKREWQGLTDDEVSAAVDDCDVYFDDEFLVDFARRIEAKLKEKNT